jgi:hypothetical protein
MLFSDWIKREKTPDGRRMSGGKFARMACISEATIYRALKYPWKGIRADTALRIVELTRGEVSMEELQPVSKYPRPPRPPKGNGEGAS